MRGERAVESRFASRRGEGVLPLVGRDGELGLLLGQWREALAGEGRAVLVVGEAGIGKSRLIRALREAVLPERPTVLLYQGSPFHADSPLWPVAQQLARAARIEPADDPATRRAKLAQVVAAVARASLREASNHLRAALAILRGVADVPRRVRLELTVLGELGGVLMALTGWGSEESRAIYGRAHELCAALDDELPIRALFGTFLNRQCRAEYAVASSIARELLAFAEQRGHVPGSFLGRRIVGCEAVFIGDLSIAETQLAKVIEAYDVRAHDLAARVVHDTRTSCLNYLAWVRLFRGYPDQASALDRRMMAVADTLGVPYNSAFAAQVGCMFHQLRGDLPVVRERAPALIELARRHGFAFFGIVGAFFRGWVGAQEGALEEAVLDMQRGLQEYRATGNEINLPYLLCLLAEVRARSGDVPAALRSVEDALGIVERTEERWFEAELHRRRGQLQLALADRRWAEATLEAGLAAARAQQARLWELRAAGDLARLWAAGGERRRAHDLLAPLYAWFTEGFDTPDLMEARALLDAVG